MISNPKTVEPLIKSHPSSPSIGIKDGFLNNNPDLI
jgi:hypothetical protein